MVSKERPIGKKQVKFARFVLAPVKVLLCGVIDFYMNAFCASAGRISKENAVMPGFVILPQVYPMPGNHGNSSTEKRSTESSTELVRVITTRNAEGNYTSEINGGGRGKSSAASESGSCLRSYSIGVGQIGIIDEDAPCDFVETNGSNKSMVYPRYAKALHFSNKDPKIGNKFQSEN